MESRSRCRIYGGLERMTADREEPHLAWLRNLIRRCCTHKRGYGNLVLPGNYRGPGFIGIYSRRTHRDRGLNGSVKSGYLIDAGGGN